MTQKRLAAFMHAPSGAVNALMHANQSAHLVSPFADLMHRVSALAFTLFVVFSVSMLVDPPLRVEVARTFANAELAMVGVVSGFNSIQQTASAAIIAPDTAYASFTSALGTAVWGVQPAVRAIVNVEVMPIPPIEMVGQE